MAEINSTSAFLADSAATAAAKAVDLSWYFPNRGFTYAELALYTALIVLLYTSFYIIGRQFYPSSKTREKSWLLTTVSSTGTSLAGTYYATLFVIYGAPVVIADDDFSKLVVTFFIVYMVLDLVIGYFEYPDQMGFLTGYFHHTAYISLLVFLWHCKLNIAFCLFLPCEIPTAIMCYGQLNKAMRHDWGFGISYFATRVAYHSYMLYVYYTNNVYGWPFVVVALILHVYWFYKWVVSQRKKGVIKDLEERYANQINRIKTQGRVARNFILRRVKRTE